MRYLTALLLIVAAFATAALAAPPAGLSDEQRRRLVAGEVILLDTLPPGAGKSSQGGTVLAVVHASAETVWSVLVDYVRHSGLYPRVVAAEVLEADAQHALVRYVVGVGPFSFGFHVNNYPDAARRRLVWSLAENRSNDLFRESSGYWQVDGGSGTALLTYAMAARTILPAFVTRGAERDGLVETVKAVRKRAEDGTARTPSAG
jgi:ribosome-associated toxin RatA of RatAB toxin-antitoxin module